MPRKTKPFEPKPFAPGALIEWTQEDAGGSRVTRRGQVWADAPICHGSPTVWAIAEDDGRAVAVCRVRKGGRVDTSASGGRFTEGEVFSETNAMTPTGALTSAAMRHAYRTRQAKAAA